MLNRLPDDVKLAADDISAAPGINVMALVKGEKRYVFLYDDNHKAEVLRVLGRFASNPELSFMWYDAAVLSLKVRGQSE